jgi:anti-sigma B factor antagonist
LVSVASFAIRKEKQEYPMILQLNKTQISPDLFRIEMSGKLMMGNDSRQVERLVGELLEAGVKRMIFDLRRLDGIDSTGVGIIVVCHARLHKAAGTLRIAGATGIVLDTLQMTHVDRIVPIFASVEEAEQNFVAAESA